MYILRYFARLSWNPCIYIFLFSDLIIAKKKKKKGKKRKREFFLILVFVVNPYDSFGLPMVYIPLLSIHRVIIEFGFHPYSWLFFFWLAYLIAFLIRCFILIYLGYVLGFCSSIELSSINIAFYL